MKVQHLCQHLTYLNKTHTHIQREREREREREAHAHTHTRTHGRTLAHTRARAHTDTDYYYFIAPTRSLLTQVMTAKTTDRNIQCSFWLDVTY